MMRLLASSGPTAVRHSKRVVEYFGGHKAPLIQLLVGVPCEGIMDDYLRTNDYFGPRPEKFVRVMRDVALSRVSPERTRLILMACPEFLSEVHDTIMKRYAAVEIYLREVCGIDQDALHKPKDRLLGKARTPRTVRCGARATPHRPRRAG
jgi:hypothetical protein